MQHKTNHSKQENVGLPTLAMFLFVVFLVGTWAVGSLIAIFTKTTFAELPAILIPPTPFILFVAVMLAMIIDGLTTTTHKRE